MSDTIPPQSPRLRRFDWLTVLGPYVGLLIVVAVLSYFTWYNGKLGLFLSLNNLRLVTLHAAITAAVALGMTLIMISGGIDLSVGYVVSLVTVVTVLTFGWVADVPLLRDAPSLCAIVAGILTAVAAGFLNGVVITKLRVVPFVATLGMMGIARGLGQYLTDGQSKTFQRDPGWVSWLRSLEPDPEWLIVSPSVWSVLIVAAIAAVLLHRTVLGRHCYAIGSNEATARLCGVNVDRTKIKLYVLAGIATGWAGIVQTARISGGKFNVQAGLELEVIAAVVIGGGSLAGGQGTIVGTLVGALTLAILDNGCTKLDLSNEFRFIVIGVIVIAVSALNTWRERRFREGR